MCAKIFRFLFSVNIFIEFEWREKKVTKSENKSFCYNFPQLMVLFKCLKWKPLLPLVWIRSRVGNCSRFSLLLYISSILFSNVPMERVVRKDLFYHCHNLPHYCCCCCCLCWCWCLYVAVNFFAHFIYGVDHFTVWDRSRENSFAPSTVFGRVMASIRYTMCAVFVYAVLLSSSSNRVYPYAH